MFGLSKLFTKEDPLWKKFQAEAERKAMFTPDIEHIQQQYGHNVFLYNECKQGGPKHDVLGPTPIYNGFAYTESSDFVLYKKLLGKETYPLALPITDDEKLGMSSLIGDPGQIIGEVFTVRPQDIISLDNYLLNTVQFNRIRVKVVIPFHADEKSPLDVKAVEVWMYVADSEFWKDQLADADAKKLLKQSSRLFCAKENNNKETLGAHFIFDYDAELETAAF